MIENCDLIVIGGGPAGSVLASLVAKQDYKVLLLERDYFPIYKEGESLLPSINPILELAGLKIEDMEGKYVSKPGGSFRWGKDEELFSFYFGACGQSSKQEENPHSTAYQVKRMEFDQQLISNAISNGVEVREGCKVVNVLEDENSRVIGISYKTPSGEQKEVYSKYVADASGHSSKLAGKTGKRIYSKLYRNVAFFGYFNEGHRLEGTASGNTLFEAFSKGWMWYIPLSEQLTSVGALIPKEKLETNKKDSVSVLNNYIEKTSVIKKLLCDATQATESPYNKIHTRSDFSYCHSKFWRPGLMLLGDSAAFVDVLLSSGVHLATYSALIGARSIVTYLSGVLPESLCFDEYEIRYKKEFLLFYQTLLGLYDQGGEAKSYQYWLRQWLAQTNACTFEMGLQKEVSRKVFSLLSGSPINNRENLKKIRRTINTILESDDEKFSLGKNLMFPSFESQLTPTENKLAWKKIV